MSLYRLFYTVFLFICVPLVSIAQQPAAPSQTSDIQAVVDAIPFKEILEESPKDLKRQFSQNPFGISSSQNKQLTTLFSEVFHPDSLLQTARKKFINSFDASYVDATLATLTSNPIESILKTESDFYTIQGIRKRIITKYELEQDKPSKERISIIKNLIKQRRAKETEIESQTILFRTWITATNKISNNLTLSSTQIEGIVNNFKNRMQMQLADELVNNYLVMYHRIDNDTLKEYVDFYASENGTEFKEAIATSIHTALDTASKQFIDSVESL